MHPALIIDRYRRLAKKQVTRIYARPLIRCAPVYRRLLRNTRFVGVTGSGGKTTTKDLIFEVLRAKFRAHKSHDSNNQLFAVARTIFALRPSVEYCVQEIGADGVGSLDDPVKLLQPSIAVVTNVRTDHCTAFDNDDGIAAEKAKLVRGLASDGVAVLNADDERVLEMARFAPGRVLTYGTCAGADVRADEVVSDWPNGLRFVLHYRGASIAGQTGLHGTHLIHCVLAAVAVGLAAGMRLAECVAPIRDFRSHLGRMSIHNSRSGIVFIRDDWKSPLWSIRYPIEFMAGVAAKRKVLVLGTISDYRGQGYSPYRDTVGHALQFVDEVVMVGEHATKATRIARRFATTAVRGFPTVRAAAEYLRDVVRPGDAVLIKGANWSQHLGRLALIFDENVQCWRIRCGKQIFCENCALMTVPDAT
jgi:UDP-N-acetylmuramyl pentapeptide synthase